MDDRDAPPKGGFATRRSRRRGTPRIASAPKRSLGHRSRIEIAHVGVVELIPLLAYALKPFLLLDVAVVVATLSISVVNTDRVEVVRILLELLQRISRFLLLLELLYLSLHFIHLFRHLLVVLLEHVECRANIFFS